MRLKINASSWFTKRFLKVDAQGVTLCDSAFGRVRKFRFEQLDCVLLSPDNVLSVQVEQDCFSIPMRPDKKQHQETLAALLRGLQETQATAA